jgi:hypothetical protein
MACDPIACCAMPLKTDWRCRQKENPLSNQAAIVIQYVDPRNQTRHEEPIDKPRAIRQRLEEIDEYYRAVLDHPIGVTLIDGRGNWMTVGLGGDLWCLVFTEVVDEVPVRQLGSLGDRTAEGSIDFYLDQWTPVPRKCLIPREQAAEAVITWIETGRLDERVVWMDDVS